LSAVNINHNFFVFAGLFCKLVESGIHLNVVLAWPNHILLQFGDIGVNELVIATVVTANEGAILSNHHGAEFTTREFILSILSSVAFKSVTLLSAANSESFFIQINCFVDFETKELKLFVVEVNHLSVVLVLFVIVLNSDYGRLKVGQVIFNWHEEDTIILVRPFQLIFQVVTYVIPLIGVISPCATPFFVAPGVSEFHESDGSSLVVDLVS
jgi:hypothetical protein